MSSLSLGPLSKSVLDQMLQESLMSESQAEMATIIGSATLRPSTGLTFTAEGHLPIHASKKDGENKNIKAMFFAPPSLVSILLNETSADLPSYHPRSTQNDGSWHEAYFSMPENFGTVSEAERNDLLLRLCNMGKPEMDKYKASSECFGVYIDSKSSLAHTLPATGSSLATNRIAKLPRKAAKTFKVPQQMVSLIGYKVENDEVFMWTAKRADVDVKSGEHLWDVMASGGLKSGKVRVEGAMEEAWEEASLDGEILGPKMKRFEHDHIGVGATRNAPFEEYLYEADIGEHEPTPNLEYAKSKGRPPEVQEFKLVLMEDLLKDIEKNPRKYTLWASVFFREFCLQMRRRNKLPEDSDSEKSNGVWSAYGHLK